MRIRLTRTDLLQWLDRMPDDDTPLIIVRFTDEGRLIAIEVDDALEEWLWPHEPD